LSSETPFLGIYLPRRVPLINQLGMYEINICMAALESNPTSGIGLQSKHLLFSWPKRIHLKAIFMHRNVQISELNMQTSMCFRCSLSWPCFLPLFILLPDLSHPIPYQLLVWRRLLVSADFMQISTVNLCRATRIHCCRSADSWLSGEGHLRGWADYK